MNPTFISGMIVGAIIQSVITLAYMAIYMWRSCKFGTFRVDKSNPDKDIYRLDIGDLSNIHKKKTVILDIDTSADLSQK